MSLAEQEYTALRETVRVRGTARPFMAVGGLAAWALALISVLVAIPNPIAALIPLLVLLTTFEAIRIVHLGVERIGRYVEVFFEEPDGAEPKSLTPPAWERTARRFGPSMPGAGGHPLFLPIFLIAIVLNFLAVLLPGAVMIELVSLTVPHAAFVVWMLYCDRAMRAQRRVELERYRALKNATGD